MRTFVRRALIAAGALFLIVVLAVAWLVLAPTRTRVITATGQADSGLIERGRYLAAASDCTSCHTARNGPAFAGGRPIGSPIGAIFSSNITPDRDTGIGAYSLDDFDRAVRHGLTRRN